MANNDNFFIGEAAYVTLHVGQQAIDSEVLVSPYMTGHAGSGLDERE